MITNKHLICVRYIYTVKWERNDILLINFFIFTGAQLQRCTIELVLNRFRITDSCTIEPLPNRFRITDSCTIEPVPNRFCRTDPCTIELVLNRFRITDSCTIEPLPNRFCITDSCTIEPVPNRFCRTDPCTIELVLNRWRVQSIRCWAILVHNRFVLDRSCWIDTVQNRAVLYRYYPADSSTLKITFDLIQSSYTLYSIIWNTTEILLLFAYYTWNNGYENWWTLRIDKRTSSVADAS